MIETRRLKNVVIFTQTMLSFVLSGKICEMCSKLTINTPERHHWHRSGVFNVNFEHFSHLVLVFLLLNLNL